VLEPGNVAQSYKSALVKSGQAFAGAIHAIGIYRYGIICRFSSYNLSV